MLASHCHCHPGTGMMMDTWTNWLSRQKWRLYTSSKARTLTSWASLAITASGSPNVRNVHQHQGPHVELILREIRWRVPSILEEPVVHPWNAQMLIPGVGLPFLLAEPQPALFSGRCGKLDPQTWNSTQHSPWPGDPFHREDGVAIGPWLHFWLEWCGLKITLSFPFFIWHYLSRHFGVITFCLSYMLLWLNITCKIHMLKS